MHILVVEGKGQWPGIAREAQQHLFDRFFRADPAREGNGTGLGLPLAGSIVQLHRGQIQLSHSRRGKRFPRERSIGAGSPPVSEIKES